MVNVDEALAGGDEGYRGWLTAEELERVRRYRFERHRREHLATRVLARAALSRYTGVTPEAWVLGVGSYGKPRVLSPDGAPEFNLANTEGLVVCAVTAKGEVGVDVEPIEGKGDPVELAETAFSAEEVAAVRAAPASERRRLFVALWTLKEAYLKARGLGMALPTNRFTVTLEGVNGGRLQFDPVVRDDPARWQLARITEIAGYCLALALADGAETRVVVRRSGTLDVHRS